MDDQAELAVLAERRRVGVAADLGEVLAVGHREGGVVLGDGDGRRTGATAGAVHRGDIDDDLVRGRVDDTRRIVRGYRRGDESGDGAAEEQATCHGGSLPTCEVAVKNRGERIVGSAL